MKTLIFGIGNIDRQDDGVAWHVMVAIKSLLDCDEAFDIAEDFFHERETELVYQLQITPEIAEEIAQYDRVCFVDAHTGAVPENIHVETISPYYQNSPLTHHMTPSSLLSIVETLFGKAPPSILVSIRGFHFGFSQELSNESKSLVPQAASLIYNWINKP